MTWLLHGALPRTSPRGLPCAASVCISSPSRARSLRLQPSRVSAGRVITCRAGRLRVSHDDQVAESFSDLLVRRRWRTGLTQHELASRLDASRRTIQDWEAGAKHPTADRLRALVAVLHEAGGLSSGREATE